MNSPASDTATLSRVVYATLGTLVLLACGSIVALNLLNVPSTDDWCNTVKSWSAVLAHPFNLYMAWTGRFITSLLQATFLYLPAGVFATVNMGITLVALASCVRLGAGHCTLQRGLALGAFAYMLLWFFMPSFGEVMVWTTGSIVYLWSTAALLLWLIPYRALLLEEAPPGWSSGATASFAVFSLMAGNGMEHTSFCAFLMGAAILLWRRYRMLPTPAWAWWGLGCLLAGWILLMIAPGNYARASSMTGISVPLLLRHSIKILKFMLEPFIALPLIYVIVSMIRTRLHRTRTPAYIFWAAFFVFFGVLNMCALIPTPLISDRTVTPSYFIIVCGIVAIVHHLFDSEAAKGLLQADKSEYKSAIAYAAVALVLLFATSIANTSWSYLRERNNYMAAMEIVAEAKKAGKTDIDLPELPTKPDPRNYHYGKRLSPNAQYWGNACFAQCYGLESVRFGYAGGAKDKNVESQGNHPANDVSEK